MMETPKWKWVGYGTSARLVVDPTMAVEVMHPFDQQCFALVYNSGREPTKFFLQATELEDAKREIVELLVQSRETDIAILRGSLGAEQEKKDAAKLMYEVLRRIAAFPAKSDNEEANLLCKLAREAIAKMVALEEG